jgi:hypothetical protein
MHCNDITGQCNPSEATLAKGIRVTPRYVRALKAKLEQKRWLSHAENPGGARGGKGISNNYELLPPPDEASRLNCSGLVDGADEPTRNCSATHPELQRYQPGTIEPPNTKNNNSNREKDICAPDLEIGIEGEILSPTTERDRFLEFDEARAEATELTAVEIEGEFETFWKQCVRAVDYGSAKKLYCRVVKDGEATPGQLLNAMMVYAAAREGQDARYTKTPARWLENSCWRDDPEAIAPKGLFERARWEAYKSRWERAAEPPPPPPPPPDPADAVRQERERELRAKAYRRKQINECKDRIRTNYRAGPHWFAETFIRKRWPS